MTITTINVLRHLHDLGTLTYKIYLLNTTYTHLSHFGNEFFIFSFEDFTKVIRYSKLLEVGLDKIESDEAVPHPTPPHVRPCLNSRIHKHSTVEFFGSIKPVLYRNRLTLGPHLLYQEGGKVLGPSRPSDDVVVLVFQVR